MKPVMDLASDVMDVLSEKTKIFADELQSLYDNNSFYLRDFMDYFYSLYGKLWWV